MDEHLSACYRWILKQQHEVEDAKPSEYKNGYEVALRDLREFIEEYAWDEGIELEVE